MSAEPSRKRKSTSTSGKRQKKVKLVATSAPDDGLKRFVETANIFQRPGFDPKVSALVEETRAAVESKKTDENVKETEKAIPHMTPLEEGELEDLLSNHYPSSPENPLTFPFHNQPLEQRESAKGWKFMRCLTQPCLIF